MSNKYKIYRCLKHLGLQSNVLGYKYISTALELMLEQPARYKGNITKELYPDVAAIHGSTMSRVERAMRFCITALFNNMAPEVQEKFFGNTVSMKTGRLSNSQFLACVALHIEMEDFKDD